MKQRQQRPEPVPKAARAKGPLRQIRIIGGLWKRTPLTVPDADGLRPTPDRVRETLFNWLEHLLHNNWTGLRCLDLFAGSGALGVEAASRGAAQVTLVENNSAALRQLEAIRAKLDAQQLAIVRGDALSVASGLAQRQPGSVDLLFVDPPYRLGWLEKILPACATLLAPAGLLYVEAEHTLDDATAPDWMAPWEVVRADRAGAVFYHLLRRKSAVRIEA